MERRTRMVLGACGVALTLGCGADGVSPPPETPSSALASRAQAPVEMDVLWRRVLPVDGEVGEDPDVHLVLLPDGGVVVSAAARGADGYTTFIERLDADGRPLWSRQVDGRFDAPLNRGAEGALILGHGDDYSGLRVSESSPGRLVVLDEDGSPRWKLDPVDSVSMGQTGGPDGTVYWCRTPITGNINVRGEIFWSQGDGVESAWLVPEPTDGRRARPLYCGHLRWAADGLVHLRSDGGRRVGAWDPATRELRWVAHVPEDARSEVVVGPDGSHHVYTETGPRRLDPVRGEWISEGPASGDLRGRVVVGPEGRVVHVDANLRGRVADAVFGGRYTRVPRLRAIFPDGAALIVDGQPPSVSKVVLDPERVIRLGS